MAWILSVCDVSKWNSGNCLRVVFKCLFSPRGPGLSATSSYNQHLNYMVTKYIGSRMNVDSLRMDDPHEYWVMRMCHWPELAASVLSEWAYITTGTFEERINLSPDTVDWITLEK